jgi:hypothetical protein
LSNGEDEDDWVNEKQSRGSTDGEQTSGTNFTGPSCADLTMLLSSGEEIDQFDVATGFLENGEEVRDMNRPITASFGKFIGKAKATVGKFIGDGPIKFQNETKSFFARKISILSSKTMRRILTAKETIHKYGVFVPRNDREADASPEAVRWASGRNWNG